MPGVFHKVEGQWRLARIAESPSQLWLDPVSIVEPADTGVPAATNACLLVRIAGRNKWAALVAGEVALYHNGVLVSAGLRILEHRDAIALEGRESVFFTTEELAHVETFGDTAPVSCPRCRSDVRPGDAVVRCPCCGVVHHEASDRNCWSYADVCAVCPQPTASDAGLRWTPEEL